jgi:ABC-type lipoprotein release transport system permease subunit
LILNKKSGKRHVYMGFVVTLGFLGVVGTIFGVICGLSL